MTTANEEILVKRPEIKLLVVDDREDNLLSIETILEKDGYIIKTANSGRAALKILLKEQDFTLILMDVQMPDLNGFETATMIYERKSLKHIPIIFITANDYGEDSIFKGYKMGGVDYINKPINAELLRAKVTVFVELYNKTHQLITQEHHLINANKRLEREIEERRISEKKIKLLNEQLLENITQLKLKNEELERFAYVASHDLQEPLRKIILFGDLLKVKYNDILQGDVQTFIDRMVKASERMKMLISNLLTFSRYSSNSSSFQNTDLNILIKEVVSDLEVSIIQKNAKIQVDELPAIDVIPDQFRRLIQNLIINALKFSKENVDPEVHIYAEKIKGRDIEELSADHANDDYYKIHIKDNGIGFEQKYANQIFVIFKRLHSYDHIEGTGIGLSICKKIAEQHNGYISASGIINKGAVFTFCLPARQRRENELIKNNLQIF